MSLLNQVNQINLELKDIFDGKFEDKLKELNQFNTKLEQKIKQSKEENESLRIGIVGQVKAGKSSFLNALFFEGENILPKATIPMTAALTNIKYSEKIKVEVVFYSEDDWGIIEENAKRYNKLYEEIEKNIKENQELSSPFENNMGMTSSLYDEDIKNSVEQQIPEEIIACKEVYDLFISNSLSKDNFGKKKTIENIDSVKDLIGELNKYVGASGKYTPIVKNTVIHVNNEKLKGIEIVDTPGTNDPIVSRGRITREYLSNCDAVFMLSYGSQFLGSEDINFLLRTLPGEGITNGYLVASKFDSVLQDQTKGKGDFKTTYIATAQQLNGQAIKHFDEILKEEPDNKIINKLKSQLPPLFISSMAFNIYKRYEELERHKEEKYWYNLITKKFKTYKFTRDSFFELSGISKIKNEDLKKLTEDKEKIFKDKVIDLQNGQRLVYKDKLVELKNEVDYKINVLKTKNVKELHENHKLIINNLKVAEGKIKTEFIKIFSAVKTKTYDIDLELENLANNEKYFHYDIETRTRTEYTGSSGHLWWKEDHYRTEHYRTANTNQAIDNASLYLSDAINLIKKNLLGIIEEEKIVKILKKIIVDTIYASDFLEFNAVEIEAPLSQVLSEINIPQIDIDRNYLLAIVDSEFSKVFSRGSDVEGSNINTLKKTHRSVQVRIKDMLITNEIRNYEKTIENKILNLEKSIVHNFEIKLEKDLKELTLQLEDSEKNIDHYETIEIVLSNAINKIS